MLLIKSTPVEKIYLRYGEVFHFVNNDTVNEISIFPARVETTSTVVLLAFFNSKHTREIKIHVARTYTLQANHIISEAVRGQVLKGRF